MQTPLQLTLGLGMRDVASFANFYPGQNLELVNALKRFTETPNDQVVFFSGLRGEGCTHLLEACCHYGHELGLRSIYIPLSDLIRYTHTSLEGLESMQLLCVDDMQVIAGNAEWEETFFHLFNRVYDSGGKWILSANQRPKDLPFHLPDLASRLSWGAIYTIHPLTDDEKREAILCHAKVRGISLSDEVMNYLMTHCPRHMKTLVAALDVLDNASLTAQRRLTIPFVKEVLQV